MARRTTLQRKTLAVIGFTMAALIAVLYITSQVIVLGSFSDQEKVDTRRGLERVRSALDDNLTALEGTTRDWAIWDDTYNFVQDQNNNYFKSNLSNNTPMISNRLNLMLFADANGHIIFAKGLDYRTDKDIAVPEALMQQVTPGSLLVKHPGAESSIKGIISVPEGPLLIASEPVMASSATGSVMGTLIFGRYLDTDEIQRLSKTTMFALTARSVSETGMPGDFKYALAQVTEQSPIYVNPTDDKTIAGYILLDDVYGKWALMLRADLPREVYARGQQTVSYYMVALFAAGVVFAAVILLLVKRLVLARLARLDEEVSSIEAEGEPAARVSMRGNDEIASLAGSINLMLGALDRSYRDQKESEERYRSVLEQATEAIFLVDAQTRQFIQANAASQAMLGYSEDDLAVLTLDAITEPDVNGTVKYRRTTTTKLHMVLERRFRRKNGTVLHVEVSDSMISYGGRRVLCVVARDITDRKRAEAVLRELAMSDGLTGLYNRREMGRILKDQCEQFQHSGQPLALIMFDIDHFKSINDTYGHQVGDDVLRWVARLSSELIPPEDNIARYGGEEFAVIMTDSNRETAYDMAEKLRKTFESLPFEFEGEDEQTVLIPITISLGVAGLPRDAHTEEGLIEAADRAMYQAKRDGRNRTVCYEHVDHRLQAVS